MVLLFTLVIMKCFQKALALKGSSFNAMRKANSHVVNVVRGSTVREDEQLNQLSQFIGQAKEFTDSGEQSQTVGIPRWQIFLEFPCSYSDRLIILREFFSLESESAYRAIEGVLSDMSRFLYTKESAAVNKINLAFRNVQRRPRPSNTGLAKILYLMILMTAIGLTLFTAQKQLYRGEVNRFTTYLLAMTFLVEFIHLLVEVRYLAVFSGIILQHSLIGLLAHNKRHSMLRSIAGWLQCEDLLDSFWRPEPIYSCKEITELVRLHVETGWKEYIRDPYSYRMFNDTRGEWTLGRNRYLQQQGWSMRRPFDESVVLWHLATDFCFHQMDHTSRDDHGSAHQCKEMSNYMVHLLSDNPEMLMPGSREKLLATAYKELEVLLQGESTPRDEKELTRKVFEKCQSAASSSSDTVSLIGNACELAQSLLSFDENETKIWDLIQGVWLEMLCFSASRCRVYLHAEALGTGVEFLSYVWILLAYTGMETFPDKLQRREGQSVVFGALILRGREEMSLLRLLARVKAPWILSLRLELSMVFFSLHPYVSP